ncbi:hypothetical protein NADFUDRAFT_49890 [Nadsonia fulvescens var. elongata DSM 6958]|uniref:Uncharacterized protein n=1 Tax=Nadsonia fulvescens var. elongata DSM 6958 TaxID=857566 RepID=A0A1E3PQ77_9ASCO|nr:hypothetical protein NADFUDRAFT_49890 [Nadsonia fulvescens var. elongata DSM 6958]
MSHIVLPGDTVDRANLVENDSAPVILGPGMYQDLSNNQYPINAGLINTTKKRSNQLIYVDYNSKRYLPAVNDHVIGIVQGKHSEGFRVSLCEGSAPVQLGEFAFPNASKKNRPNLPNGALVYARVSAAERNIESEIECIDPTTGKDGGFGELKGGFVFDISLAYARKLLFKGGIILEFIGECAPFEIAIGVNGKIWIDAPDVRTIIAVKDCIQGSEHMAPEMVRAFVGETFKSK